MKIRNYAILGILLVMTMVLTACSNTADTTVETGNSASQTEDSTAQTGDLTDLNMPAESDATIGIVTQVDGGNITLTLGTLGKFGGMPGSGDAPDGDAPSGDTATGGKPSGNAPSGDAAANSKPSGDAPSGDSTTGKTPNGTVPSGTPSDIGMESSLFTEGEESYSFTITDESIIYQQSDSDAEDTLASLSDIVQGKILSLELDDAGSITKITILNATSSEQKK